MKECALVMFALIISPNEENCLVYDTVFWYVEQNEPS